MSTSEVELFTIHETQQPYKIELRHRTRFKTEPNESLRIALARLYAVESVEAYKYSMAIYFAAHLKTPEEMAKDVAEALQNYIDSQHWLNGATIASYAKRR